MPEDLNNKKKAEQLALQRAVAELQQVDLKQRCALLDLPAPGADGEVLVEVFGRTMALSRCGSDARYAESGTRPKPADVIQALHYLLHDTPVRLSGDYVTFRDFPGGQFYWGPFLSRSIKPLTARTGNDINGLRHRLEQRFKWQPSDVAGDFAATIHAVGKFNALLVYHTGDEEFPPDASLLFDSAMRHVFPAEHAAVIASRICLGLL